MRNSPQESPELWTDDHRMQTLIDAMPALISYIDSSLTYRLVNRTYAEWFGATVDSFLGKTVGEVLGEDAFALIKPHLLEALAGRVTSYEMHLPYLTGGPRYIEAHYTPDIVAGGLVRGIFVMVKDLTARRRAEESLKQSENALRESEKRYRFLAESIPQIVFTARHDGVVNYHNEKLLEFLGTTRPQMQELGWIHFRHPEDREEASRIWNHSIATGEPYECMYRMLRGCDQAWRWHLARATPMRDESGQIVMWFGTCTDIDDQKRIEEELGNAKSQAEAANSAKDQFLATLSHELRTPLTPVVLALDSIQHDPALPGEFRDDLKMIQHNVALEATLIDDLLDLTRVARGKLQLHHEVVDVHAALDHAVRSCCEPDCLGKSISVHMQLQASKHHVRADAARLQQVFFNVLRNAVKFTNHGGSVSVQTRDADGRLTIEVADDGVGIDAHVLPHIFNAFEQGDPTVTRRFGGLGLGLAISRAIVELHGGSIQAFSDGRDRGSTFRIQLPLTEPVARGGAPQAIKPSLARRKLRILLVEDHEETAELMSRLLERLAYDVHVAGDVESARRVAAESPPDLVISDIGLPDGSGLELMRDLRERFAMKGIALSGYGMEIDLLQSRAAGFDEHLVKPVRFDALEAAIARVVG